MADFTEARRAMIDTEGDDEGHALVEHVPRRALEEWIPLDLAAGWNDYAPVVPGDKKVPKPVGPIWKAVWWTEGAVIILLVSILIGMKVLPWIINR